MANSISFPSPAKLNLFLHILGKRPDGYHLLQTVFQFVDLCDTLEFELTEKNEEALIYPTPIFSNIPQEENLIIRAVRLLQRHCNIKKGVKIKAHKKIPLGGGLGGGSSNAATTLVALNTLWDLRLSRSELATLGLSIGADVPIFIHGKASWAEGIGEKFQAITLSEPWYVILTPPCHVPTAKIYSDPELTRDTPPIKISDFLSGLGNNDFEPLVCKRYPMVAKALAWLRQYGSARLTGSGSSIFGSFSSEVQARKVAEQIPSPFAGYVVKGLNCSPLATT